MLLSESESVVVCLSRCVRVSLEEGLVYSSLAEVVADVRAENTSVPVVRHVTSVVDPGYQVLQCIPGNLLVLVQVQTQQTLTHLWVNTGSTKS